MGKDWRDCLEDSLRTSEGEIKFPRQELAIVENLVKKKLMADSLAAYILQNEMLNKRKRSVYPVVEQWLKLSESMNADLKAIGIKRRARPIQGLAELLAKGNSAA